MTNCNKYDIITNVIIFQAKCGVAERIIFHHSATNFTSTNETQIINEIKRIQNLHINGNGWADIGYHYIIDPNGSIWEGRPLDKQGSHASGYNDDIGVLILGDFEQRLINPTPNELNQNQKKAMQSLSKWLCCSLVLSKINSGQDVAPISTHRTVNPNATVCPGQEAATWIEGDLREYINNWGS